MEKRFKWVMEEPALMDNDNQYRWLEYGSYNRLFVVDELWAQSLQLFSAEKIYLPMGGDDLIFKPISTKKDINVLFLDISSVPEDDLSTKLVRKKIIRWLRERGFNPFVFSKKTSGPVLNELYNRAEIIVYINPLLLKTDFSNVVYDILLSGSFLLTDHKTNAEKLFDGQLTTFKNSNQLVNHLTYFLNHEDEAKEKVKILQEIVLQNHTIRKRRECLKIYE